MSGAGVLPTRGEGEIHFWSAAPPRQPKQTNATTVPRVALGDELAVAPILRPSRPRGSRLSSRTRLGTAKIKNST